MLPNNKIAHAMRNSIRIRLVNMTKPSPIRVVAPRMRAGGAGKPMSQQGLLVASNFNHHDERRSNTATSKPLGILRISVINTMLAPIKNVHNIGAKMRLLKKPASEMGNPQPMSSGMVTKARMICINKACRMVRYICAVILSII